MTDTSMVPRKSEEGHQQQGRRYGVIVQANELLPRSAVLVAPTSRSAKPASFRPEIELLGETTRVLVEQVGAVDVGRLGELVGKVSPEQQWGIDDALMGRSRFRMLSGFPGAGCAVSGRGGRWRGRRGGRCRRGC